MFNRRVLMALLCVSWLTAVVSINSSSEPALAVPAGFEITSELSDLRRPTSFKFAADGRVFVSEHRGTIQVFDDLSDQTATEVVDLRDRVHAIDGRGLLAIELDPGFPIDPYLYALYTYDGIIGGPPSLYSEPGGNEDECPTPPGPGRCIAAARLSRFTIAGDVATTETVLIEDWCQTDIHSVGDLAWGPSGELYASHGDGAFGGQPDYGQRNGNLCGDAPGVAGVALTLPNAEGGAMRAQDYVTASDPLGLNGSIIRVDPATGLGWHDNPNAASGRENERRLVAHGFRNPFRLELRPGTDEVWTGDVGWNSWEEVNVVVDPRAPVKNYGWPCYEGPSRGYDIGLSLCEDLYDTPGAVTHASFSYRQSDPISAVDACRHTSGSITGLQFYEGGAYPAGYDDSLFMADSSRECVWVIRAGADGKPDFGTAETLWTGDVIVDIELGPGGDVYMLDLFDEGAGGQILRVAYPGGELRPTARLLSDVTTGPAPLAVQFDAGFSSPGQAGGALNFAWDLDGDGDFDDAGNAPTATKVYAAEGRVVARVRVTDAAGATDTASVTIVAGTPPVVTISEPSASLDWSVGDIVAFSGSATDGGQPLPASALSWDLVMHHCETLDDCHAHLTSTYSGVSSGTFETPDHEYPAYLELLLTATDAAGLKATTSVELLPATTTITVDTAPAGLEVILNGDRRPAPLTHEVIVGSTSTVTAPLGGVDGAGTNYEFGSWSDGGDRTHDIVIGPAGAHITANYSESVAPRLEVSNVSVAEVVGTAVVAEFVLTLSYPSTKLVTVMVKTADGSAGRADYVQINTPVRVVFRPGQTSQTASVKIKNDPLDEPTETFFLDVVSVTNALVGNGRGTAFIADDDPARYVSTIEAPIPEGDAPSAVRNAIIRLAGASSFPASALAEVVGGTAVPGVDFAPIPPTTLHWSAGSNVATLPVTVFGNDVPNEHKTIILRLSDPAGLELRRENVTVVIIDDEVGIVATAASVAEGNTGFRQVRVPVSLSGPSSVPVEVRVTTRDGTATAADDDYVPLDRVVTFAPGVRRVTVVVSVAGDTADEPTEQFEVVLTEASGAAIRTFSTTITIRNDD